MGGWGSGRDPYATTLTVEECHTLDVNVFTELVDHPRALAPYAWRDDYGKGETVAEIGVRALPLDDASADRATHLRLEYTATDTRADETTEHEYPVALDYTACHFGGARPWFRCPAVGCGARVGKLYRPPRGQVFACRECHELGYRSSRESGDDMKQALRRFQRAQRKLGVSPTHPESGSYDSLYPERPKGMHRSTYEERIAELDAAREEWHETFFVELTALRANLAE